MIVFDDGNSSFLLSCPFDEGIADYSDNYILYKLPDRLVADMDATDDWNAMEASGVRIGLIPAIQLEFDATRRKELKLRN